MFHFGTSATIQDFLTVQNKCNRQGILDNSATLYDHLVIGYDK